MKFLVMFSLLLLTGCSRTPETCTSGVKSVVNQSFASFSSGEIGGLFTTKIFHSFDGEDVEYVYSDCNFVLGNKIGNSLTLLTSLHCLNFDKYIDNLINLKFFKKGEKAAGYVNLHANVINNKELNTIGELKRSYFDIPSEVLKNVLSSHVPSRDSYSICQDNELDILSEIGLEKEYETACYSDAEIGILKVELDPLSNTLFEKHFSSYKPVSTSEIEEILLAAKRNASLHFMYDDLFDLLSEEGIGFVKSFNHDAIAKALYSPSGENFGQLYKNIISKLDNSDELANYRNTVLSPLYNGTASSEGSKAALERLRSQRFDRLLTSNFKFKVKVNGKPFSDPTNEDKMAMFDIFTSSFGKDVLIQQEEFMYKLDTNLRTITVGFHDKSPLQLESGDSGAAVIINGELLAVISTLNSRKIQRATSSDLPVYIDDISPEDTLVGSDSLAEDGTLPAIDLAKEPINNSGDAIAIGQASASRSSAVGACH